MTLATGARLGPYAIQTLIGVGGMGEVYRAIDTRLDRTVAVKVLRQVAGSQTRRLRFEREARAISRLSHPHICALHDVGEDEGAPFLVMEYLEGESLAQRLLRGALPIEEVLRHAIEIADALDQAHRQGVVHRDLKPANIMLTRSGVKLLDFGVAKLCAADPAAGASAAGVRLADTLTEEGTIVGTPQYMAPEQLEEGEVGARTDLFAFGAVVYEMAAGRPAFEGKSHATLIAAILERDPAPLSAVRRETPPLLSQVITQCLAKDPDQRWQTASDLGQALKWIAHSGSQIDAQAPVSTPGRWRQKHLAWPAAGVLIVTATLATLALVIVSSRRVPTESRPSRFVVSPPSGATFDESSAFMTVSPDGRSLAFVASSRQGNSNLWVRSLDSLAARQLPGTNGAARPFWSPDSRFLAFVSVGTEGKWKKIDVSSGLSQTLGDGSGPGTWNRDDVIVFLKQGRSGLDRISAAGGPATPVTTLDRSRVETGHTWPHFLPDGRHFLYVAGSRQPEYDGVLCIGSLDSKERTTLFHVDSQAVYVPPGYLVFMLANTLLAQPFDARSLRVTGEPVLIAGQVERTTGTRRGAFTASYTGDVLAYRPIGESQLTWFDRGGRQLHPIGSPAHYANPAMSPDERRLAVDRLDPATGTTDIWLIDLARGIPSRFTFDPSEDNMPLWSADGSRIVFRSNRRSPPSRPMGPGFYEKASSATGHDQLVLARGGTPLGWSRDGRFLLYDGGYGLTHNVDLWILPLAGDREPVPFLRTEFNERQGQPSPDGRWIAYVSDESSQNEVYVRPFPTGDGRWRVSTNGGVEPTWRSDGKELFYLAPDHTLMSVAMKADSTVEVGPPARLFETRMSALTNPSYTRNQYVVTADGQRFLINQPPAAAPLSPITVVLNWLEELKQRVPVK